MPVFSEEKTGIQMTIGDRIKKTRGEASRKDLASALGIHVQTLGNYERGERQPDAVFLQAVCDLYGVSPAWLLTGEGEMLRTEGQVAALSSNTLHTLYKEKGPPSAAEQLADLDAAMNGQVKRFAESRPFESNLARLKAATEMAVQLTEGWPGGLPVGVALVFQELLISGDLTEHGARRLLEALRDRGEGKG